MQQVRGDNATSGDDNGKKCGIIGSIITITIELTKEKYIAVKHQCKFYLMGKICQESGRKKLTIST
jgi:hypothetical protein